MENKRNIQLDTIRIVAAFLVIVNHTVSLVFESQSQPDAFWFVSVATFFFSKVAVPLFLMISGYLLLNRIDDWKYNLKRILRIIIVLAICSFAYSSINNLYPLSNFSMSEILKDALSFYNRQPSRALWYLYAYLGILVMLPFLQKLVLQMNRKDFHIFFLISGIFISTLPVLKHYFEQISIEYHFAIPLFHSYIGYLFIGNYFRKFKLDYSRKNKTIMISILLASVLFNTLATYFEFIKNQKDYLFFDNITLIPIVIESIALFYLIINTNVPAKLINITSYIASCTFGIYLIGDLVIRVLQPVYEMSCEFINCFVANILFQIMSFSVGLIIIIPIRKIPLFKKLL